MQIISGLFQIRFDNVLIQTVDAKENRISINQLLINSSSVSTFPKV